MESSNLEPVSPNWAEVTTALGTVALAVFTLALAVAAGFALFQVNEARRARNAHVALEVSSRWSDQNFRRVRQQVDMANRGEGKLLEAMKAHYRQGAEQYRLFLMEPDYFEDLALLVNYRLIDFAVVRDSLGITVARRWDVWRPWIEYVRNEIPNATAFSLFEGLANDIRTAEALSASRKRK